MLSSCCTRLAILLSWHYFFSSNIWKQFIDKTNSHWAVSLPQVLNSKVAKVRIYEQSVNIVKQTGETRVLFLGDSGTQGAGIDSKLTFASVFENKLGRLLSSKNVRAINAAVYGMNTVDEFLLFRDGLIKLNPDYVVLGVFMANDINYNLASHPSWTSPTRRQSTYTLLEFVKRNSLFAQFLVVRITLLLERLNSTAIQKGTNQTDLGSVFGIKDSSGLNLLSYPEGEMATYLKESAVLEDAYLFFAEILQRFKGLCDPLRCKIVPVLIPTASSVSNSFRMLKPSHAAAVLAKKGVAWTDSTVNYQKPVSRIKEICAQIGLSCVDPTDEFRKHPVEDLFTFQDNHLSELGHLIVAEKLIDHFMIEEFRED